MSKLLEQTEQARIALEKAAEDNFGYVGSDKHAVKCLEECSLLERQLKHNNPEEWAMYCQKHY